MKTVTVFALIMVAACARPQDSKGATILKYESENIGVDGYKFAFDTSDGISRQEEGQIINAGTENEAVAVRGSFKWKDKDGKEWSVTFVADENGYQPQLSK